MFWNRYEVRVSTLTSAATLAVNAAESQQIKDLLHQVKAALDEEDNYPTVTITIDGRFLFFFVSSPGLDCYLIY